MCDYFFVCPSLPYVFGCPPLSLPQCLHFCFISVLVSLENELACTNLLHYVQ